MAWAGASPLRMPESRTGFFAPWTCFQVKWAPLYQRLHGVMQLVKFLPLKACTACEYRLDVAARLDSRQAGRWTDNEGIESPSSRSLRNRNTSALLRDSRTSVRASLVNSLGPGRSIRKSEMSSSKGKLVVISQQELATYPLLGPIECCHEYGATLARCSTGRTQTSGLRMQ